MTFSYVVTASEENFFLSERSSSDASSGSGQGTPILVQKLINGGGAAIRLSWHVFFEKVLVGEGGVYSARKATF